jgi:uncharacterized protein
MKRGYRRMWLAQLLVVIGALNWGLIGFFGFDLVAALFGGQMAFLSRVVYGLVGIAGLVAAARLFAPGRLQERR